MKLNLKISFLFLFCLFLLTYETYGQKKNDDYKFVDSLIAQKNNSEALLFLEKKHDEAQKDYDTLELIKIYDYYIKIFQNDSSINNSKKFLVFKTNILKFYFLNHPDKKFLKTDLIKSYYDLAQIYFRQKDYFHELNIYFSIFIFFRNFLNQTDNLDLNLKIANTYLQLSDFEKSLKYFDTTFYYATKLADTNYLFQTHVGLGDLYLKFALYSQSVNEYSLALSYANISDNKFKKVIANQKLADVFYKIEFYSKAIEFYSDVLVIYRADSLSFSQEEVIKLYNNIGRCNIKQGQIDDALTIFYKSLNIARKIDNINNIALCYCYLGIAYTEDENFEFAENYLNKAILIAEKLNDSTILFEIKLAMGEYYYKIKKYEKAKFFLINAFNIIQNTDNFSEIKEVSNLLQNIFKTQKKFDEALRYSEYYQAASDSLIKINNFLAISKIDAENQYNTNYKQSQIIIKDLQNSKNKLTVFIVILVLALISLILFFYFFQKRTKELRKTRGFVEKQKEIILKQYDRNKLLSVVANNTPNSIFIMDPNWKIIWVNEYLMKMYNVSHFNIFSEMEADYKKLTFGNFEEIKRSCEELRKSITFTSNVRLNNKDVWLQTTISPVIENDNIVYFIGIEVEISSLMKVQKEAERQKFDIEHKNKLLEIYNRELKDQKEEINAQNEELRQQHEELITRSELLEQYNNELQRLSVVASETENMIYFFDVAGNLIWANNAFTKYTGFTLEEFLSERGRTIIEISSVSEIDYYFYLCTEQKKSVKYVSEFKTRYGKTIWLQTTLSPIKDAKGKVIEVVGIDSDITDIKKAEIKIFEQNQEIKKSLEYASKIQRSVLPLPIFLNAVFEKYFIFNKPRDIVSGDFYFVDFDSNKALVVLADSTGHGIPGALMSVLGSLAIKNCVDNFGYKDLNSFLLNLNNMIIQLLHQQGKKSDTIDSIDMALCVVDFNNFSIEFAGANIPLYIARKINNYKVNRIKPNKVTIGYNPIDEPVTIHSFKFEKGDRLFFASDGFADQFGGDMNKRLMRKGFISALEMLNKSEFESFEQNLEQFLIQWSGSNEQVDDILVIGVEF